MSSITVGTEETDSEVLGMCLQCGSSLILGLLTLFTAGIFPTTNKNDPTWVQAPLPKGVLPQPSSDASQLSGDASSA